MRDNYKLIVKAKVMKQITETYELDCTGLSTDAIKSYMDNAPSAIDREDCWYCSHWETDHEEVEMKLEIVDNA